MEMGLFNALTGNATKLDPERIAAEFAPLLAPGEGIAGAWRMVRDLVVMTNRRLILVDRQGVTGRKTEYLSIPFRDVARFAFETAGSFDLDSELRIWVRGEAEPIALQFPRGGAGIEVQRILAAGVLG